MSLVILIISFPNSILLFSRSRILGLLHLILFLPFWLLILLQFRLMGFLRGASHEGLARTVFRGRKNKMQIVGVVMHKLIRIVYGVLKSGKPFDQTKLALPNVVLEEETDFLPASP